MFWLTVNGGCGFIYTYEGVVVCPRDLNEGRGDGRGGKHRGFTEGIRGGPTSGGGKEERDGQGEERQGERREKQIEATQTNSVHNSFTRGRERLSKEEYRAGQEEVRSGRKTSRKKFRYVSCNRWKCGKLLLCFLTHDDVFRPRARVCQIADQRTARYPVTFALHIALLLEHNRCCVDVAPANDFVGDQVSGSRDEETTSGSGLGLFRFCHFSCSVFCVASLVLCKIILWFKIAPVLSL